MINKVYFTYQENYIWVLGFFCCRPQACNSSSWSYYSLSLSVSISQVLALHVCISNHSGLCLRCDYRILEGNPLTELNLERWFKIWKSRNYTTKKPGQHIYRCFHLSKDTMAMLLLLWIEPRALSMLSTL